MNVRFLDAAQSELREAVNWYNNERAGLGDDLQVEVDRALDRICDWPCASTLLNKRVRLCMTGRFPYGLVYVIREDEILVLAFGHLHRRPGYWKNRLKDLGP